MTGATFLTFSPTNLTHCGMHTIKVILTDGKEQVPFTFFVEVLNRAPEYATSVNGTEYTIEVGENKDIIMPSIVSLDGGIPIVAIISGPAFVSIINSKDLNAFPTTSADAKDHLVTLEISLAGHPNKSYYKIILKVLNIETGTKKGMQD
jgi:hypothetical protein